MPIIVPGTAIPVYKLLSQNGPEPSCERSAAHVVAELGDTLAILFGDAIEFRVQRIRKFSPCALILGHGVSSLIQRGAIPCHENFPGGLVAQDASASEGQLLRMQALEERNEVPV